MTTWLILWCAMVCAIHGVPLKNALAVAHIESRNKHHAFRVGRLGKSQYFGPFGIRSCFASADDPERNIVLGVSAIARLTKKYGSFREGMKRYNTEFTESYWTAIKQSMMEIGGDKYHKKGKPFLWWEKCTNLNFHSKARRKYMTRNGRPYWSFQDEKEYLNSLGTGKWSKATISIRKQLLENYLDIILQRSEEWAPYAYAYALKLFKEEG